jgi:hypothetical protein
MSPLAGRQLCRHQQYTNDHNITVNTDQLTEIPKFLIPYVSYSTPLSNDNTCINYMGKKATTNTFALNKYSTLGTTWMAI